MPRMTSVLDREWLAAVELVLVEDLMKSKLVALVASVAMVAAVSFSVSAQRTDKGQAAQALATRVGQILGAATACRDVARPRISNMTDMLMEAFKASTSNEDELKAVRQLYEKNVADGQNAVKSRRIDCTAADRNLADLEQATATKAPVASAPPPPASSTPLATAAPPPQAAGVPPAPVAAGVAPLPRTIAAVALPAPAVAAPAAPAAPRRAPPALHPAPAPPAAPSLTHPARNLARGRP